MKRVTAFLFALLAATSLMAQSPVPDYELRLDIQKTDKPFSIRNISAGNTPLIRCYFETQGATYYVTNWGGVFSYGTNGQDSSTWVQISGVNYTNYIDFQASASDFPTNGRFFSEVILTNTASKIITWGQGETIVKKSRSGNSGVLDLGSTVNWGTVTSYLNPDSGPVLPGSGVTATTNSDGQVTFAVSGGDGTPVDSRTATNNIAMGGYKITGLATGTATNDAVNKLQMDTADGVVSNYAVGLTADLAKLDGSRLYTGTQRFGTNSLDQVKDLTITGARVKQLALSADIEAEVSAATAGDTLVLASGTYTITDDIDIAKAIAIRGQGVGKTIIALNAQQKNAFEITANSVTISDLSITHSATDTNRAVFINGVGGTVITGTELRNLSIDGGTTSDGGQPLIHSIDASGKIIDVKVIGGSASAPSVIAFQAENESTAETTTEWKVYNSSFIPSGTTAYGIYVLDDSATQDVTVYAYDCIIDSGDASTKYGVYVGNGDAYFVGYDCLIDGADGDAVSSSGGGLTLTDCTLVNNTTSGTITYSGSQNWIPGTLNGTNGVYVPIITGGTTTNFWLLAK